MAQPGVSVQVRSLADRLDLVATLAGWHWREWGDAGAVPSGWVSTVRARASATGVPFTLVALLGDEPCGCLSVCWDDADAAFSAEGPWLSGMLVLPAARNLGIGRRLLAEAENRCRRSGHGSLWLHTAEAQRFYERCGWRVVRPKRAPGQRDAVLTRTVSPPHERSAR